MCDLNNDTLCNVLQHVLWDIDNLDDLNRRSGLRTHMPEVAWEPFMGRGCVKTYDLNGNKDGDNHTLHITTQKGSLPGGPNIHNFHLNLKSCICVLCLHNNTTPVASAMIEVSCCKVNSAIICTLSFPIDRGFSMPNGHLLNTMTVCIRAPPLLGLYLWLNGAISKWCEVLYRSLGAESMAFGLYELHQRDADSMGWIKDSVSSVKYTGIVRG